MKKLFFFFAFACSFSNAQYLIDDNDVSESSKELGRPSISYDLNNPLEFYRLKCGNPIYAQFPGGENAFKQNLFKNIKSYLDTGIYSVNGTFELVIHLDKAGNMQRFVLKPEVLNGNMLYRDLDLALKKMKVDFAPASCDGLPVESKIRQKINFRTDNFDI